MAKRSDYDLVTDHAIIRWLERVEGYDIDEIREKLIDPTDQTILQYLWNNYGLCRGHAVYKIITPPVRHAIAMGATRLNRGRLTLIIEGGKVVTIAPRNASHPGRQFVYRHLSP